MGSVRLWRAWVAAAILALLVVATPTAATSPGVNGKIAFVSLRDGNPEIYTMDPDGANVVRLTNNGVPDEEPAWSPDGTKIAFASDVSAPASVTDAAARAKYREIYIMNADGSGVTQVTHDQQEEDDPSWAPDGMHLTYDGVTPDGQHHDVFRIDVSGQNAQDLTPNINGYAYSPQWAPKSNVIVFSLFSNADQHNEILVMSAEGGERTLLSPSDSDSDQASWSPDGTRLVFRSSRNDGNDELYLMAADGTGLQRLTHDDNVAETDPKFSPDGSRIVYERNWNGVYVDPKDTSGKNIEIDVMNADGTGDVRLTNNQVLDAFADWQPLVNRAPGTPGIPSLSGGASPSHTGVIALAWTPATDPDGDAITYTLQQRDGSATAEWRTVQNDLMTPNFSFTSTSPEAEGTWNYRVAATDSRGAASAYSSAGPSVVVDTTAPSPPQLAIAPGQTAVGVAGTDWYRDSVSVAVTPGQDPALRDGTPGSGVDPTSYTATLSVSANGVSTIARTDADRAGNVSAASASLAVHVDAAAPHVAISCPATAILGAVITATVTAGDGESGLNVDPSGIKSIPTSTVGPQVTAATAVDNVGHSSSAGCTTNVEYNFGGLVLPGNAKDSFKTGQAIPLSFALTDASGARVATAVATLDVAPVDPDGKIGTYQAAVAPGQSKSGNTFTWNNVAADYEYTLSTHSFSPGQYRLRVTLDDGTAHTVTITAR